MQVQVVLSETRVVSRVYEVETEDELRAEELAEEQAEKDRLAGKFNTGPEGVYRGALMEVDYDARTEVRYRREHGATGSLANDYDDVPVIKEVE